MRHPAVLRLVRYATARWRIEHDYREPKTGLGLDPFEGRSWIGWNRHVTLVAIAPGHVNEVRRLVFDRLTAAQTHQLTIIGRRIMRAIDPDGRCLDDGA